MCGIRCRQNLLPLLQNYFRLPMMHDRRREESQACVMMRLIVPREEGLRPRARVEQTPEAFWIARAILQGLELRFGIRIVIRHMRARVIL